MDSSQQALLTNGKLFLKFKLVFKLLAGNRKNIQTNSEVWILIKAQYIIYQWILLDMLYKLMESIFQISELFFELTTII